MADAIGDTAKKVSYNRLAHFRIAVRSVLTQVSQCISLEKFTEIFADVDTLKSNPSRIKKLWLIYQESIFTNMMDEFEEFIKEENLDEKFNLLSKLKNESPLDEHTVAWRPVTGDIHQQLCSHDMKDALKRKQELETFVLEKEMKVGFLRKNVISQRSKRLKHVSDVTQINRVSENVFNTEQNVVAALFPVVVEENIT